MAKKILSGNGWSFEPAGGGDDKEEVVSLPGDRQKASVKLEKRARGKEVTLVSGFVLSDADRKDLAQRLRKSCGTGGSDAAGTIEVQGDHRAKVTAFLQSLGWKVR